MKRHFKTIAFSIAALSISVASHAQDVHIPEKGMPGPVPVQTPEAVELKGQARSDVAMKIAENYGVPPIVYMAYDPVTKLILVNTKNGPTLYTNRNVDFVIGKTQSGGIGLYANVKNKIEDRTEVLQRPFVIDQMATLKEPVVYKSENEKYRVSVFVEPTCGYCYKLHSEMQSYLDAGITLVYYPFPIYGEFSEETMARLWSLPESERAEAITEVKDYLNNNRNEIRGKSAEDVLSRFNLPEATDEARRIVQMTQNVGHNLGIGGTPALVLENGKLLPGYMPADALKNVIEQGN